jgi:SOS-response transcriptional repressor LexA
MTEALDRLRKAMEEPPADRPTPFVGFGLSVAATGGHPYASWSDLLIDGIGVCERVVSPLPSGWADQWKAYLKMADAASQLTAADEITRRLQAVRGGREFDYWIERAIGGLHPTAEGEKLIEVVCDLGHLVVTTNYDVLIEDFQSAWSAITWTDAEFGRTVKANKVVVHLHGMIGKPKSIILSGGDYERLRSDELAEAISKALYQANGFVFIGCGDSPSDPDLMPLRTFIDRAALPRDDKEHYLLVRGRHLRQFIERPILPSIVPVAYGDEFTELRPFLEKLARGERIDVSQDPKFYEQLAAARPAGVLDLVRAAQEKLQNALAVLDRAAPQMRDVERYSAMPAGMSSWHPDEQEPVHQELAASVADPAARLESCLEQAIPAFESAEAQVWQFTAPKFARLADWVAPVMERVSKLEETSRLLLNGVTRARDDMRIRAEIYADYQPPYRALERAHTNIERAADIALSLQTGLSRLPGKAQGKPHASQPAPQESRSYAVRPDQDEADADSSSRVLDAPPSRREGAVGLDSGRAPDTPPPEDGTIFELKTRSIPLFEEVGAGNPLEADDQEARYYLALPEKYVGEAGVFMLEVRGDSMTGEDGVLEHDYVIVDREARRENGDMVLAFIAEYNGCAIKRFWKEHDVVRLESSNPDHKPEVFTSDDEVTIHGKVIGVLRWHIEKAYRRNGPQEGGEPSSA